MVQQSKASTTSDRAAAPETFRHPAVIMSSAKLPDHRDRLVVDRRSDSARLQFDVLQRGLDLGLRHLVPAPVGPFVLYGWNFADQYRGPCL